jgi:hypothetical protein
MSHRARPAPFVIVADRETGHAVGSAARDAGYAGPILLVSCHSALPAGGLATGALRWFRDARVDLLLGACTEHVDAGRRVVVVRGHGEIVYGRLLVDLAWRGPDADWPHLDPAPGLAVVRAPTLAEAQAAVRTLLEDPGGHSPMPVVNPSKTCVSLGRRQGPIVPTDRTSEAAGTTPAT